MRKAAAKKKPAKKKAAAEKKPAAKKPAAKKKAVAKKKPAAKKKATSKKKPAAKSSAAGKKAPAKKAKSQKATTSASSKKAKSSVTAKATSKKAPAKKKPAAKKAPTTEAASEATTPTRAPRPRSVSSEPTFTPYKAKRNEEYMNEEQKNHFRDILLQWKQQLMEEVDRTVTHMKDEAANYPDPADRASQEEEFSLELKTRDRERKLIRKIDNTLELIDQDDYGYCESCGIEIGVQRLEARPTATQCIDCKTLDEIKERQLHGS